MKNYNNTKNLLLFCKYLFMIAGVYLLTVGHWFVGSVFIFSSFQYYILQNAFGKGISKDVSDRVMDSLDMYKNLNRFNKRKFNRDFKKIKK